MVRDGWIMVVPLAGMSIICVVINFFSPGVIWVFLATVIALLAMFVGFFFRDPTRWPPQGEGLVISGGDGRVVAIEDIQNESFIGGPAVQISVFLSIFNVHVNRIPITGVVRLRKGIEGQFRLAFKNEASSENSQMVLGIEGEQGKVLIKQIVGYVARRIVCNVQEGEEVEIGERFGLIRFGSRIDVVVPTGTDIRVKPGDRVRAGETILGVFK